MKKWFLNLSGSDESQEKKFIASSKFFEEPIDLTSAAIQLKKFLTKDTELQSEITQLDEFCEDGLEVPIVLFDNNEIEANFVITSDEIYIRQFFYQTLTLRIENEFKSFLLLQKIFKNLLLEDLLIYLAKELPDFLALRKTQLVDEEFIELYEQFNDETKSALLGLLFVSKIHYHHYDQLNLIEKKNLKEIFFLKKIKKMLELEDDDYDYIQKSVRFENLSERDQARFQEIKQKIDSEKIQFIDYLEEHLTGKKILFWCLWAMSPFLAWDINQFFSMLNQYKKIKKIYLDLPVTSQSTLNQVMEATHFNESLVEQEIKKIYPQIIDDYAMETLPYLKLLERAHAFKIPIHCFGVSGEEMIKLMPDLRDDKLVFPTDQNWQELIEQEISKARFANEDELVVFFYFLKPTYQLKQPWGEYDELETLLHTDSFTGFGPQKFGNSLSLYSRYQLSKSNSFVLTDIDKIFKNEPIISFPHQDKLYFELEETYFNRFNLYNSLLYSTPRGGGGGSEWEISPDQPRRRRQLI